VHIVPLINNAYADIHENITRLEHIVDGLGCKVDIVGHSEGGLIARAYVKFRDAAENVPHVVTIGTPNQGLTFDRYDPSRLIRNEIARRATGIARKRMAPLVEQLSSAALNQMLAGSDFMTELNARPATPGPTKWLSMGSPHDLIVPYDTTALPSARNVEHRKLSTGWVNGSHAGIATTNVEAFRATLHFLSR
jgi:triacylglycerol esterase/lipase EstA (alpha/beta hydrolase family)